MELRTNICDTCKSDIFLLVIVRYFFFSFIKIYLFYIFIHTTVSLFHLHLEILYLYVIICTIFLLAYNQSEEFLYLILSEFNCAIKINENSIFYLNFDIKHDA